jgi:2-aminoadipate transaminase
MLPAIQLDPGSEVPLYRQLHESIRRSIVSGQIVQGERLPANRELAGLLGVNRTTIAAAFELLESEGLIKCLVGRGTFVDASKVQISPETGISFASSRPPEDQFPIEEFRVTCREVIDSSEASNILQLGSAAGYGPLRRWVLNEVRKRGAASADDDILITSGVQQAFDLIQRVVASRGETVLMEDPVYPGVRNVFQRGGARVVGIPVGPDGIDLAALELALEKERARVMVLTPNFQNPTGTTIPEFVRVQILELARRAGTMVVENDLYGAMRYSGADVPPMKTLDRTGETILLGGFSKIAFPGLRVGWAIGPRAFIAQLTEAKEVSDLHSDQLSQAVLLRFAESGRLAEHHRKTRAAGLDRLKACMEGCAVELPKGSTFTRPEGGMNAWVNLPEPMDASELAVKAAAEGVSYLPGRYFAVARPHTHSLRLSFAGIAPEEIRRGLRILGSVFRKEQERARRGYRTEPSPALV